MDTYGVINRYLSISLITLLHIYGLRIRTTDAGIMQEYCQWESFNATCHQNQVIMLEHARYGRMSVGRCVNKYFDEVGCKTNVLSYLDSKCSGRKSCLVTVASIAMQGYRPCSEELTSYLEASYRCVPAISVKQDECRYPKYYQLTQTSGFLASEALPTDSGYGYSCYFRIYGSPGQKVNFTLYDFSVAQNAETGSTSTGMALCRRYALVKETTGVRETPICGGQERVRNVYISDSHNVEIRLLNANTPEDKAYFMIHYQVSGCSKLTTPKNGFIEKSGATWIVGCNKTAQRWYVKCEGSKWIGQIGNCTQDLQPSIWSVLTDDWSSPYGILVVVGLGVALGIVIGVVLLIVVLLWLKRRNKWVHRPNRDCQEKTLGSNDPNEQFSRNYQSTMDYNPEPNYASWMSQRPLPHPADDGTLKRGSHDFQIVDPTLRGDATQMTNPRPNYTHVYESPKFGRREFPAMET